MASFYDKICREANQDKNPYVSKLRGVFESLDDEELLDALKGKVHRGCQGYTVVALWRSYLARYALNLRSVAELIRTLESNPLVCEATGIDCNAIPHESTYSRFVKRLSEHTNLVENVLLDAVDILKEHLEDFGKILAVDATDIHAYSNGYKPEDRRSDTDATWAKKKKNNKDYWWYGYKVHMVSDAVHELPVCLTVTTAKESDMRNFITPLKRSRVNPDVVTADAGYDAVYNYVYVAEELKAVPVIDLNKRGRKGNKPPHRAKSELYKYELRNNPGIPRDTDMWKHYYNKRTSVERVFSRMKEHRSLDGITHRGIEKVTLHCYLSTLTIVASAVSALELGQPLRKVA